MDEDDVVDDDDVDDGGDGADACAAACSLIPLPPCAFERWRPSSTSLGGDCLVLVGPGRPAGSVVLDLLLGLLLLFLWRAQPEMFSCSLPPLIQIHFHCCVL